MNKAFRLMELIGEVDDKFIEVSMKKPTKHRVFNPWHLVMAALLALALLGGGTAFLKWGGNVFDGAQSAAVTADSAAAEETAVEAAEPAEAPAEEAPEAEEAAPAEEAPVPKPEEAGGNMDGKAPDEEEPVSGTDPRVAAYLEGLSIGPLYLGMPEAEVLSAIGDPKNKSNSEPITREDGITIVSWFYSGYSLQLADAGGGYVVNEIFVGSESNLALSNGIGIGSTEDEVTALDLPFAVEDSVSYVGDENGEREIQNADYILVDGSRTLDISTADGVVDCFSFGTFYPEPELDWDALFGNDEPSYDMSGDPITVYARQGDDWREVELTGKDAKRLEVILNIEELLPGDDLRKPQYVIDFHNGTVVSLCGDDEGGAVYTCPEGVTFSPDMLDTLDRSLELYRNCTFPEGVWDTVKELTAS